MADVLSLVSGMIMLLNSYDYFVSLHFPIAFPVFTWKILERYKLKQHKLEYFRNDMRQ